MNYLVVICFFFFVLGFSANGQVNQSPCVDALIERGNFVALKNVRGPRLVEFFPDDRIVLKALSYLLQMRDVNAKNTTPDEMDGHKKVITALGASGTLAVTGDEAGNVAIWDLATQRRKRNFVKVHPTAVTSAAIRSDGKFTVTTDEKSAVLRAKGGSAVHTFTGAGGFKVCAFSPDGVFAVAGDSAGRVVVWRTDRSAKPLERILETDGISGAVTSLAFGPNYELAIGTERGEVAIWDLNRDIKTLIGASPRLAGGGHGSAVTSLAFHPRGLVARGYADGQIVFMTLDSHNDVVAFQFSTRSAVSNLLFSVRGEHVMGITDDRSLAIWNINTREKVSEVHLPSLR